MKNANARFNSAVFSLKYTICANGRVLLELGGIAILLTLLSSGIAVLHILRYEPLKILSNRE